MVTGDVDQITSVVSSFDVNEPRCLICFEALGYDGATSTSMMVCYQNVDKCDHNICDSCTVQLCRVAADQNIYRIPCPSMQCDSAFDVWALVAFLKKRGEKELAFSLEQSAIIGIHSVVYCANPSCSEPFVYAGDAGPETALVVCSTCKAENCMKCRELWHEGNACRAFPGNLSCLEKYKKLATCPRCKVHVERVGGCNRMSCVCGQIFCYNCGKQYKRGREPHIYVPTCACTEDYPNALRRTLRKLRRFCTPSCCRVRELWREEVDARLSLREPYIYSVTQGRRRLRRYI